ncbi:microsomal glutathione S-transferase 1-like [Rhynchophorus ferrugineus]|uniref:Microsomal glutathione S-transferase 1 n=1 Tax=Rhynchophorus ferrugineus TaxID=354439 RepID=A0A834IJX7_RHYFE|nr:hypothetical protein GWI33_006722 [Rhynchophorus ferrugineus]
MSPIAFDNALLRIYFFYASLLGVKMLAMSVLTALQRFKTKTFANPEDCHMHKVKVSHNESVERVRRAHLNDLENIPIFLLISLGYLSTGPSYDLALYLFRAFALGRFLHTFVYAIVVIPQPARVLSWSVGYVVTIYMAVSTLITLL